MRFTKLKLTRFMLMLALLLPTAWSTANGTYMADGVSHITIKEAKVQSAPKGSSIQASIDGHYLTVVFTENLGSVAVEITTASGTTVENYWSFTPNGMQTYLSLTGDYVVTFTLPNGDEYYGEFTVTD